ncbi:MAG: hypothetical protein G01um101416_770 [Microgenomates group bacterium Gr01-1014_16]|nr:MAG: hypothetical protein G01um101416_770 [Microgenomates group bacterium Gr01-1014_16]
MKVSFEKEKSIVFGNIFRPYFPVNFWSRKRKSWIEVLTIVDTGADYTMLPIQYMDELGIDKKKDASPFSTFGVGGDSKVYILNDEIEIQLAGKTLKAPLGFVDSVDVPPLLGRHRCLEKFRVVFENRETEIV